MSMLRVRGAPQLGALLLLLAMPIAARTPPANSPVPDPAAAPTAASNQDPSAQASEIMPRASKSLLLDVVRTPAGFFAAGERGHVLHSTDGKAWTQLEVPTRSTLTTITAVDGQLWAAGHDGVIVHSADAGKTWQAQRRDPYLLPAGVHPADHDPRQGVPIMDIRFSDAANGIAIGAYSLMLVTADGGRTWTAQEAIAPSDEPAAPEAPMEGDIFSDEDLLLEDEANPHLNALVDAGGVMVIVGERGTLLRSTDRGASWNRLDFPYKGSMFGVLHLGGERLLAYGLRGNVYESADLGLSWHKVAAPGSVSLMGGSALDDGGAILVGPNGLLVHRADGASPFRVQGYATASGQSPTLAGIVPAGGGNFVVVGDNGVDLFHLK